MREYLENNKQLMEKKQRVKVEKVIASENVDKAVDKVVDKPKRGKKAKKQETE